MRLQWKLFLIILCSSALLVLSMFITMQWSVDRGLLKYVNIREQQANQEIIRQLAHAYSIDNDWLFLDNAPELLHRFARNADPGGRDGPPPHGRPSEQGDRRPPPPPELWGRPGETLVDRRLSPREHRPPMNQPPPFTVLDAHKNRVAGEVVDQDTTLTEIRYPGSDKLIGWLGFRSPKRLTDDFDLALADELKTGFISVSVATLLISSALAIPLSFLLVRRIRKITEATRQVARGDFSYRVQDASKDELGQLASHFNELAHTLEATDSARKRWIADISHELRTPLAVTSGEIEAMLDGIRPATEENLRSALDEIKHLNRLIDDLYQLSNADIGALQYHKKRLNLGSLVENELAHFQTSAKQVGLMLEFIQKDLDVFVMGDANRLKQLLHNLINNALKYTDAPGKIQVSLSAENNRAVLSIEDSLPGVPPESVAKLFDPLYRVESSRSRKTGGSGLGLAICRQIVIGHQGTIEARPSALGGLQLIIHLPLA